VVGLADVDEAAARFTRFLAREAIPTNMGRGFFLERGGVQLVNAATLRRLMPKLEIPSLPFIGSYALRVGSLSATETLLRANGLSVERRDRMLAVPFPNGLGVGAWFFVEHADDLPWRRGS